MRRRKQPAERDLEYRHNALIEVYNRGFPYSSDFSSYQDNGCTVNYQGRLYEGFLLGFSSLKMPDRFLIYIKDIEFGSDGTESALTQGKVYRGGDYNHVWCSLAADPEDLLLRANTFYVNAIYSRLSRDVTLYIDICTWYALEEKYGASENKIRDGLYNLFCEKSVLFAKQHSIRHLDLED